MFGYLQVKKSELRIREYEAYKAVYCGLCRQLGKDYSVLARLSLSYDCTFYAILLMSLSKSCSGFRDGRCKANPLKKCKFASCADESYNKAAALTVISVYYKLTDDIRDGGFFKRLLCRCLKPFFGRWRKKAMKRYPYLEECVSEMMELQQKAEQNEGSGIDDAAHPTARMLSKILISEARDDIGRTVLGELGYQIGRWIYIIDAADDYDKDKKSHNFNPFLNSDKADIKEYMNQTLSQCLARAYDAYELLTVVDFKGILDNMMLYGFPSKQQSVIYGRQEEENVKSI